MRLVSIELQGFKSFVDKTKIQFTDGITAIVGPNGSGKSNIIEAIRWVMGETSAKSMRSDKMTDIIFSGTDNRKAVNIAQVSLLLDNSDRFLASDYDELMITRRLQRDGHSDFYINKKKLRLKDIHDLFMDSGLGKESFSIIGQGSVDQVLNNKPEERRSIIEEAAGVLKYKNRKKEAETKLQESKANLDRLQDILHEIEKQRNRLEKDSQEAKVYLELDEKLKEKDVFLNSYEIFHSNQKFIGLIEELKQVSISITSQDQDIQRLQNQLEEIENKIQHLSQELDSKQESRLDKVRKIEQEESSLKLLDEQEKHQKELKADLDEQEKQQDSQIKECNQSLDRLTSDLKDLDKKLTENQEELTNIKTLIKSLDGNKEDLLADLRTDYFELLREQSQIKNEIAYIEKSMKQSQARLQRIQEKCGEQEQRKQDLEENLNLSHFHLQEKKKKLDQLEEKVQIQRNQHVTIQKKLETEGQQLAQVKQSFQGKKGQYQSLSSIQESYRGYYQGVQAIMKQKNKIEGIIGTIAELIRLPEGLEKAIDTALGSSSQFVVVKNQAVGRQAIDYLKHHRAGRATFLPLDTIKVRSIGQNQLTQLQASPGFVGVASDLVEYDSKLGNIFKHLLGRIIISQNLKTATDLSKQVDQRYKVVSLEGDVVNVGGSMTGGAHKGGQSLGLLSQKQKLDKVAKEMKELQEQSQDLSKSLRSGQDEEEHLKQTVETLEEEKIKIREEIKDSQFKLQQLQNQIQQAEKEAKGLNFDYQEASKEKEGYHSQVQKLKDTFKEVEGNIQEKSDEMKKIEDDWSGRKEKLEAFKQTMSNLEETRQSMLLDKKGQEKERDMILEQKNRLFLDKKSSQQRLSAITSKDYDSLRREKREHIKLLKEELEKLEEEQVDQVQTRKKLQVQKDDLEKSMESARKKYNDLLKEQKRLELSHSKIESKLQQSLSYLNENYAISYDDLDQQELVQTIAEEDLAILRQEIDSLKRKIKELGPVKLSSIEEFEQVQERYQFLIEQRDDLYSAKEDIFSTMKEMDQEVEERFYTTFQAVQEKFSEIFPAIFGGGQAELLLTDENDLLHTGIEIKAQPPGKNLRSLNLLSGGERSLTAISLLFAIIQANPIPFVILDEVEASLDDANVLRFSQYLKKFKEEDIQFLVITHRKGTMEVADSLYGIVMQEQGVSSVLSVNLSQTDQFYNHKDRVN